MGRYRTSVPLCPVTRDLLSAEAPQTDGWDAFMIRVLFVLKESEGELGETSKRFEDLLQEYVDEYEPDLEWEEYDDLPIEPPTNETGKAEATIEPR